MDNRDLDSKRLDWLDSFGSFSFTCKKQGSISGWTEILFRTRESSESIRERIDSQMKAELLGAFSRCGYCGSVIDGSCDVISGTETQKDGNVKTLAHRKCVEMANIYG